MLYFLLYETAPALRQPVPRFRLRHVPHRFASLTALFLCIALGPWLISKLRQFQIGQYIREEGPKSHQKKAGTPTMGGVLIIISIVIPTLLWAESALPVCLDRARRAGGLRLDRLPRRLRQGHEAGAIWGSPDSASWSISSRWASPSPPVLLIMRAYGQLLHHHERSVLQAIQAVTAD